VDECAREDAQVDRGGTAAQLEAIAWLHAALTERGLDHWLFGGWAVDLHLGRVTREHDDVDLAVWRSDLDEIEGLLLGAGWVRREGADADGYTAYTRGAVRLELAFLARDGSGVVHTPLQEGRGEWPTGSFGTDEGEVEGVRARVVGRASLEADKSLPRDDAVAAAKDRADVAALEGLDQLVLAGSGAVRWLDYCLAKPGAWPDEPWHGDVVAKVGPKIFAFLGAVDHPVSIGLKCGDRETADLWLERYPGSVTVMAYIGRHGWNTFALDGAIPDDELAELVDRSYDLVVAALPRSQRP
jgi:predicted DNA-binding protein (MmcQ/YjbR family)